MSILQGTYSSWQKGSVENANKLVRQYLPKKTNFDNVDYQEMIKIQKNINNRPRKITNFENPKNLLLELYTFAPRLDDSYLTTLVGRQI